MKDGILQASDLMIGDWVLAYGKKTQIVWVGNIHKMAVRGFPYEFMDGEIEPIPLTPEILKKNGFEWTTRKSYMVSCIGTVRMIWGFYKDCLSISDNSDDGECQISSLKCKFVHELQHALRLCKIEKEIEL